MRFARTDRIGLGQDHVVSKASQNRDDRSPAKPPHRPGHQLRDNLTAGSGVQTFHQWNVDQIEKIQQTNPGYPRGQMNPAKNDQLGLAPAYRESNGSLPQAKSSQRKKSHVSSTRLEGPSIPHHLAGRIVPLQKKECEDTLGRVRRV